MNSLTETVDITKDLQITMPLGFWWKYETFGDFMENRFTMAWEIFPLLIQQLDFSECERKDFTISYWTVGPKEFFTFSVPIPVPMDFQGHGNTGTTGNARQSTMEDEGSTGTTGNARQSTMEDEDVDMGDGLRGMVFDIEGRPIRSNDEEDEVDELDELEELKRNIIEVANSYIISCMNFKKKFSIGSTLLYYDYYCGGSVIDPDREDPHEQDALSQPVSIDSPNSSPNRFLEIFSHFNTQRLFQRSIEELNTNTDIEPKLKGQWTAPLKYMC